MHENSGSSQQRRGWGSSEKTVFAPKAMGAIRTWVPKYLPDRLILSSHTCAGISELWPTYTTLTSLNHITSRFYQWSVGEWYLNQRFNSKCLQCEWVLIFFFSAFRSLSVLRQILYKFSVISSVNLFLIKASPTLLAADNLGLHFTHIRVYFKCVTFYLCICVHSLRISYYIFWLFLLSLLQLPPNPLHASLRTQLHAHCHCLSVSYI